RHGRHHHGSRLHRSGHGNGRLHEARDRKQGDGEQDEGNLRRRPRKEPEEAVRKMNLRRGLLWSAFALVLLSAGCSEKWDMTQRPVRDEELDTAFFAGRDSKEVADVPEPASLRPCCIFGTDVGAQVRSVPVPLYEIHNILDIDTLGTHQYNKGSVALVPRGGER